MSNRLQANILLILILVGLFFIALAPSVFAADITFTPQISIPGVSAGKISPTSIGSYIIAIYKYAIGIVGILATVVMMIGGIIWLTAGGNSTRIEDAKSWISASLTGLIIALCSFLILSTVNPALTTFKPINPDIVGQLPANQLSQFKNNGTKDCCEGFDGTYYRNATKDNCSISFGGTWHVGGETADGNNCRENVAAMTGCCLRAKNNSCNTGPAFGFYTIGMNTTKFECNKYTGSDFSENKVSVFIRQETCRAGGQDFYYSHYECQ